MKTILSLALFVTLSAHADSFFTGSSDDGLRPEFQLNEGNYFVGASDSHEKTRELASQEKKSKELELKDDAYFTGSSF